MSKKIFFSILILFLIFLIFDQAKAQPAGRECSTNLMLVLDVSSSMGTGCGPSQDRAKDFIDKFMEKPELRNWGGVVHFGYEYNGYRTKLSQELTSDKKAVRDRISQSCKDHTPIESGIVMGMEELNEEGAKPASAGVPKVMIFFTDGAPNACASDTCYCSAGAEECNTTDVCSSAACDYDPDGPGPKKPSSADDAINTANIARTTGIRIFVIGFGPSVNHSFNKSLASDNCPTTANPPTYQDPPYCYWRAPTKEQLGPVYDAIFLIIADKDGDGFVDVKCGGNDLDDTEPCVNPNSKEVVKYGVGPGDCNSNSSVATLFDLRDPDGDIRADYVCGFKYYGYECNGQEKGICILGCEDTFDNDQDEKIDLDEKACPLFILGGLVPCGRRSDEPRTPEFESCPCRLCHFLVLGDKIVDFTLLYLVIPLAILLIVVGGAILLTAAGSPEKVRSGKTILKTTIIGLVIIFAAWLIVNTILIFIGVADWTGLKTGWWQIKCPVPSVCDFQVCMVDDTPNPCYLSGESCP